MQRLRSFEQLNLRFNPFGELERENRARVALVEPIALERGRHIQIVAEAGRGKSTHLTAWQHANPTYPLVYLAEGENRLRIARPYPDFLFLDEAQRLCRRDLHRLKRTTTLIMGSHEPMEARLKERVEDFALPSIDVQALRSIFERRIRFASRPGRAARFGLTRATLLELSQRYGSDLRAIESELYDRAQRAISNATGLYVEI